MLFQAACRTLGSSNSIVSGLTRRLLPAHLASHSASGTTPRIRSVSSTATVVGYPARVSVKAYYIGRSILFQELYAAHQGRKVLRQDCAILYGPFLSDVSGRLEAQDRNKPSASVLDREFGLQPEGSGTAADPPTPADPAREADSFAPRSTAQAASSSSSSTSTPPSSQHPYDGQLSYELTLRSQVQQQRLLQQQQEGRVGPQREDPLEAEGSHAHQHLLPGASHQPQQPSGRLNAQPVAWSQEGVAWEDGQGLLVATRFGAAVFFEVPEEDHWPIIRVLLPGVTLQPVPYTVIADGRTWKNEPEELQVMVRPHMQRYVEKREDCLWLQRLDVGSVHVIATCIGQSIALQHHMWMLNTMMTQFHTLRTNALQQLQGTQLQGSAVSLLDVLRSVRMLGPAAETHDLARLVAGLNKLRIEMAVGLQLLEYHPMAWQKDRYDQLWAVLRREFELQEMHALLNKKLKTVAEEAAYDMDDSYHSRYMRLVWVVVGLLLLGNLVDVWDLLGKPILAGAAGNVD